MGHPIIKSNAWTFAHATGYPCNIKVHPIVHGPMRFGKLRTKEITNFYLPPETLLNQSLN